MTDIQNIRYKGQIRNLGDLKGGIKRTGMFGNKLLETIFDKIDAQGTKDGALDDKEIQLLQNEIIKFAKRGKNEKFSGREANRLLKSLGINDAKGSDLFVLLNILVDQSNKMATAQNESVVTENTIPTSQATAPIQEAKPQATTVHEENGVITTTSDDGNTIEIKDGNSVTTIVKDPENGRETITTEKDGKTTILQKQDGKNISQTITKDGKTYNINYDGEGNTRGIIVQNGESLAMLAKKFNCSIEDIINANPDSIKGKGNNKYFLVGQEIKIPKELDADDKSLENRTSAQEAIKGYEIFIAKREAAQAQAQAQAEAEAKAQAQVQAEAQAQAEAEAKAQKQVELQKEGKSIANALYEDMDGIGTSSTFKENIAKITTENVVQVIQGYSEKSPDESLAETILDESGMNLKERKAAVKHIYTQLLTKAHKNGVDTAQIEKAFDKAIKLPHGFANNEDFDPIFNSLVSAINSKSLLTAEDKAKLKILTPQEHKSKTLGLLNNTVDNAEKSLETQLKQDGWSADLWEGMKWVGGSENLDENVKKDIETYKAQVAELENTKSQEEFKAKFKEIYGKDFDPELVEAYKQRQEKMPVVEMVHGLEVSFNKQMKELLSSERLTGRQQYVQTSSFGTGNYIETVNKEQVYKENLEKFAEFAGGGDKKVGLEAIKTAFESANVTDDTPIDEKYKVLHELASNFSKNLHQNTLNVSEGKGYNAFKTEAENSYKAAFGLENDIAKRVADYNTSQQVGGMVVNGVVKAGAAIGLTLIPGVGLVGAAVGTAAISATADVTDKMYASAKVDADGNLTSMQFKNIKAPTSEEIDTILKNAAIDGATVFAGGKLTQMLSKASTFTKIGGQMLGDVVVGAGAEKLQTGQITINGVIFQALFSATGNLAALKNIGKNPKASPLPEMPDTPVRISKGVKGEVNNHRNAISDAEVARNADVKHLNANERKMLDNSLKDTPTPAELNAYNKKYGYQAPTNEEAKAILRNNANAAKANSEAHQIGNNGKFINESGPKLPKETIQKLNEDLKGIEGSIRRKEQQIAGAKRFGKDTSKLESELSTLKGKLEAKALEIENANKVANAPKIEEPKAEVKPNKEVKASAEAEVKPNKEVKASAEAEVKQFPKHGIALYEHDYTPNMKWESAIEQSRSFNETHRINAGDKVLDGYRDGGRGLVFDVNGNAVTTPRREIIVVDRQADKHLQKMIKEVSDKTKNMTEKQKAAFLQQYVYNRAGSYKEKFANDWEFANTGKEVLLGDIINNSGVAVCRHRSLLFKILGDNIGLKIELQRGNFISPRARGGHAWNTVQFEDGTSAIYDAMHNKTSLLTPRALDEYAKYYFSVNNKILYANGMKNSIKGSSVQGRNGANLQQRPRIEPDGNAHLYIKCSPNTPLKVDADTKIRLANSVELDLKDLQTKLSKMKDGDSFIIGRSVNGANDIQIDNNYISRQHLKIEKINGEIYLTDLSSTNGTRIEY